jgi:hypothetical protein
VAFGHYKNSKFPKLAVEFDIPDKTRAAFCILQLLRDVRWSIGELRNLRTDYPTEYSRVVNELCQVELWAEYQQEGIRTLFQTFRSENLLLITEKMFRNSRRGSKAVVDSL